MNINEEAVKILLALSEEEQFPGDSKKGEYLLQGEDIREKTALSPSEINEAINYLSGKLLVNVYTFYSKPPYAFEYVEITPRGMYVIKEVKSSRVVKVDSSIHAHTADEAKPIQRIDENISKEILTGLAPVGSPYGFTADDWSAVESNKKDGKRIVVCFGYQWKSDYYNSSQLQTNVKSMFDDALKSLTAKYNFDVKLDFRKLEGGYGEHLFNEIARNIISSDIAVFDTSDLNPNVMIELGIALTWGLKVLLVREEKSERPPSDISGQTWAEYRDSAGEWIYDGHQRQLEKMLESSIKLKVRKREFTTK